MARALCKKKPTGTAFHQLVKADIEEAICEKYGTPDTVVPIEWVEGSIQKHKAMYYETFGKEIGEGNICYKAVMQQIRGDVKIEAMRRIEADVMYEGWNMEHGVPIERPQYGNSAKAKYMERHGGYTGRERIEAYMYRDPPTY